MSKGSSRKFSLPTFKSRSRPQDIEEFLMPSGNSNNNQTNSSSKKSPAMINSPSLNNLQENKNTITSPSSSGGELCGTNSNSNSTKSSSSTTGSHLLTVPNKFNASSNSNNSSGSSEGDMSSSVSLPSSSPTSPRLFGNNNNRRLSKTPPTSVTSPPVSPRGNFFSMLLNRGKSSDSSPTTLTPATMESGDGSIRIGLFGCEGSGKSTLFKQCEKVFGEGYSRKAVFHSTTFIQQNLVDVLKTLFSGILNEKSNNHNLALDWATSQKMKTFLSKHASDKFLGDTVCEASVWHEILQDSRVKQILDNIHEYKELSYSIGNCIEFYVNDYERLTSPDYKASEEDYIRFQQKTTGVVSRSYTHKDKSVVVMDIGGVRTERKKWPLVMKSCQYLCYVVSLSEFDEMCWEDESINRLSEDLATFKEWSKGVNDQPIFLIFTNLDRFRRKINTPNKLSILNSILSIENCNNSPNAIEEFYLDSIIKKFQELDIDSKVIQTVVTNSLDMDDVSVKLTSIFDKSI